MMDLFFNNQAGFWLGLGFVLLAIELIAFGLGSGVLLFGSIGALITGALLWFGIIPNEFMFGVACFTVSTALATALLWKPMKKLQSGTELGQDRSSDLIGHSFFLSDSINRTVHFQQKYSGIQWRVEPDVNLPDPAIEAGQKVAVSAVNAGVFYVKPVNDTPK